MPGRMESRLQISGMPEFLRVLSFLLTIIVK